MEIRVISGTHPSFLAKANVILKIYNDESSTPFDEILDISKPESLRLIFVDGVEGGVITDEWNKNGTLLFHSIMFAAFSPLDRKKGHLRACIDNAGFPIETVQINGGDPIDIWEKLGFVRSGTLGFTFMLRTKDFEGVDWGICIPSQ